MPPSCFAGGLAINQPRYVTRALAVGSAERNGFKELATVTRPEGNGELDPCPSCRGQGWKVRIARRALLVGDAVEADEHSGERTCLDCRGSGRAEGSA